MKKLSLEKYLSIAVLFFWSLFETMNWYRGGLIYYGDQDVFLYKGVNNYLYYFYAPFHFYTYPGVPNNILFNYFYVIMFLFGKIPITNNQEILNLVSLFVASLGMLLLSKKILSNILLTINQSLANYLQLLISSTVAIFYISNWSIELAPTFLPLYQEFVIYMILPWVLYLLVSSFETNNLNFFHVLIASFLTAIVIIVGNYSFLEQNVIIIGAFLIYSIFIMKKVENHKRLMFSKKLLLYLSNVFILIFFMIYPLYLIIKTTLNPYFITASTQYFTGNSSSNYFYLSLMDLGPGGSSLRYSYPTMAITFGLLIIFVSYILPVQYLVLKKNNRLTLEFLFIIFVGLLFVAFYSGLNTSSPFYPIIKYLFSSTNIFSEFRTNAFAVSFYYALILSILIGIGTLVSVFGIKKKKFRVLFIALIFIIVNVVFPFPVITGSHDSNLGNVQIPSYVDSAYNFTEHLDGKHNVLLLPQSYLWSYTNYYTGDNMLQHISKDPIITGSPYQERYNNYSDRLYNEYCNATSTIYNNKVNRSNQLYLQNLFYLMNVKYVYFQSNLNYNETKYNQSLISLFNNTTLFKSVYQFKNISIYETNIRSSFLFATNDTSTESILTNETTLKDTNLTKVLTPICNYTFNEYDDNFNFKMIHKNFILMTFIYNNDYFLGNSSSTPILWFNEFNNLKGMDQKVEINYRSTTINNERLEYIIGILIFILEISVMGGVYVIKRKNDYI